MLSLLQMSQYIIVVIFSVLLCYVLPNNAEGKFVSFLWCTACIKNNGSGLQLIVHHMLKCLGFRMKSSNSIKV